MTTESFIFTSESVAEGHPDKVCDLIADSVLDAYLMKDPESHVACEVLCKDNQIILAGEISSSAKIDLAETAREAVRKIGYTDPAEPFCASTAHVHLLLSQQSREIAEGVVHQNREDQGAGDQGIMFGFATDETPELMPLPILLAHRLARTMAEDRKAGAIAWLRPDAKTQVSVRYEGRVPREVTTVLVSTQHAREVSQQDIRAYVAESLLPRSIGSWFRKDIQLLVNPAGSFAQGGPSADCGVTGRKIMVDTYGGMARHGGGAFSGKDASKVDRTGAYYCRYVARQLVKQELAKRAEVQVSYAIGKADPLSIFVETFGTGDHAAATEYVKANFDFRPASIIAQFGLLRPIYRETTNYGHFGKPGLPWEV